MNVFASLMLVLRNQWYKTDVRRIEDVEPLTFLIMSRCEESAKIAPLDYLLDKNEAFLVIGCRERTNSRVGRTVIRKN